jgi:hypothetical protein
VSSSPVIPTSQYTWQQIRAALDAALTRRKQDAALNLVYREGLDYAAPVITETLIDDVRRSLVAAEAIESIKLKPQNEPTDQCPPNQ